MYASSLTFLCTSEQIICGTTGAPYIASPNNAAVTGRYEINRLSKLLSCRVRGHDMRDNFFDTDYRVKTNTWLASTNKLLVFYWSPPAAVRISMTELASVLPANHREDIK
jgi:hypothetical protein